MQAWYIASWAERYEVTDQGRPARKGQAARVRPLAYVRLKVNGFSQGPGYRRLRKATGTCRKLQATFAVWCKLLELSADQVRERRGWILNDQGLPASAEDIAFYTGFSASDIRQAMDVLCSSEVAWIRLKTYRNLQGPVGTSAYTYTYTDTDTETETEPPPTPSQIPPQDDLALAAFERFWSAWPKHRRQRAKKQCLAAWRKRHLAKYADQIMAVLEADKKSHGWTKDGGEFIPAPLVWLNGDRWDCDLDSLNAPATGEIGGLPAPRNPTSEELDIALGEDRVRGPDET